MVEWCRVERRIDFWNMTGASWAFNSIAPAGLAISLPIVGLTLPFVFAAFVGPGRRCRRPLPVAASVEKSEDNATYTLHLICHNKKKIAGLTPDAVLFSGFD